MIWESSYWKADLLRRAAWLKQKQKQDRWSEAAFAALEQQVMIGFYCIRKLSEANNPPPRLAKKNVRVDAFQFNGQPVDSTNWDMVGLHYSLNQKTHLQASVIWLCHQFVHSFVFVPSFRGPYGPLDGIYFNSDREKHKFLYRVTIRTIVSLFRLA
jgi:hypothetical protein